MAKNQISLQQLKSDLAAEQAARDAVIEKGARAYRLGILQPNNPEKELSRRNLWDIGWEAARAKFTALLKKYGCENGRLLWQA